MQWFYIYIANGYFPLLWNNLRNWICKPKQLCWSNGEMKGTKWKQRKHNNGMKRIFSVKRIIIFQTFYFKDIFFNKLFGIAPLYVSKIMATILVKLHTVPLTMCGKSMILFSRYESHKWMHWTVSHQMNKFRWIIEFFRNFVETFAGHTNCFQYSL